MPDPQSTAVLVSQVSKTYRTYVRLRGRLFPQSSEVPALRKISFTIARGDMVGLLGRNGSGKSTLMRVLAGVLAPTEGAVTAQQKPRLFGLAGLQLPDLSVLENAELMLRAHGYSAKESKNLAQDLVWDADLADKALLPYKTLSTGMKARMSFLLTIINEPEILLLDEMLSVGDQKLQEISTRWTDSLQASNRTVIIASHNMATIQSMCSRAIVLVNGEIGFDGPVEDAIKFHVA